MAILSTTIEHNTRVSKLYLSKCQRIRQSLVNDPNIKRDRRETGRLSDSLRSASDRLRVRHARLQNLTRTAVMLPVDILQQIFLFCATERFAGKHYEVFYTNSCQRILTERAAKRALWAEASEEGFQAESDTVLDDEVDEKQLISDMEGFLHARDLLSHVCSRWREIAIATPELWARISLNWVVPQQELWLRRCGLAPVQIYMTGEYWDNYDINRLPDSARIVSICLDLSDLGDYAVEDSDCLLAHLAQSHLPKLEDLRLYNTPPPDRHRCTCLDFTNFLPPTSLRYLTLNRCKPSGLNLIVSSVTHLTLQGVSYDLMVWMTVLESCPVEVLFMQECFCSMFSASRARQLRLPELRVLHYIISDKRVPLLQVLLAPKLRTFVIDDDLNTVNETGINLIASFVSL